MKKMVRIMMEHLGYLGRTKYPILKSNAQFDILNLLIQSSPFIEDEVRMGPVLVEELFNNGGVNSSDKLLGQPKLPSQDWWQRVVFPTRPRRAAAEQRECNVRILCKDQEIVVANKVILSAR